VAKFTSNASFYRRGQGEIQFSFKGPTWSEGGDHQRVERNGCVFVEAAKAIPNSDKSDWDKKILIGLGFNDFGQILSGLRTGAGVKLFHKHPSTGDTSKLEIEPGQQAGTFKVFISGKQADGESGFVNIFLSTADITSLVNLIEFATPRVLGWDV